MQPSDAQAQVQEPPAELGPLDIAPLNTYLLASVCTLLDISKDKFYLKLHEPANQETVTHFVQDKGTRALLVSKTVDTKEEMAEQASTTASTATAVDAQPQDYVIRITTKVEYTGQHAHTIAFLKREPFPQLDMRGDEAGDPISRQIQLLNLGYIGEDFTIFELASTYVEHSLLPLFNSFQQTRQTSSAGNTSGSTGQQQTVHMQIIHSMNQLKLYLSQCQQNIVVPEIELQHDPEIRAKHEEFKAAGKELTAAEFEGRLQDQSFVRRLEKLVTIWIRDIRRITTLDHDPSTGTALQEINFWLAIERSLTHVESQLTRNPMLETTLELLKQSNNMPLVYRFRLDTELEQKLQMARSYNQLLRNFAINQLLAATDLEQIRRAIDQIFSQFRQIRQQGDGYPNQRAILLLKTVISDLNDQLLKVLANFQIMKLEYSQFKGLERQVNQVFQLLLDKIGEFKQNINQARARLDPRSMQVMEQISKNQLKERIDRVGLFRGHHHRLTKIITQTLSNEVSGDKQNLDEVAMNSINDAYQLFHDINVLDISREGAELWEQTERTYNVRIDRVVSQITAILKAKLSSAQNANEMFRTFQIFNPLFAMPKIKGAVQEYQARLIETVEQDVEVLREKMRQNMDQEEHGSGVLSRVRGFPDISNKILWMKQIERRLAVYMRRVEDVLGANWQELPLGRSLKKTGDNFRQSLLTRQKHYIDTWQDEVKKLEPTKEKEKCIYNIEQRIDRYHFYLDFNEHLVNLPQELNQLKIMGMQFLLSIHLKAQDVQTLYPMAMSLRESLKTFEYTESRVIPKFAKLVAEVRLTAQDAMMRGLGIQWKSDTIVQRYAKELRRGVTDFEEAVNDVIEKIALIDEYLEELAAAELDQKVLSEVIEKIQKIIDEFEIQSYSNLQIWVDSLDKRISEILVDRLEKRIALWVREFTQNPDDSEAQLTIVEVMTMRIKMQNQTFTLDPPLAQARAYLYTQLHQQVEAVCGLQRVEAQRYGRTRNDRTRERTYLSLVKQMKEYDITQAYERLEEVLKASQQYFNIWRQYQALWDLQSTQIYDMIGDDVEKWTQLLNEIREGRKTFDSSEDKKSFGAIIINYGNVKQDVNNKYDQWHKEILNKFGSKLKVQMRDFYKTIQEARRKLEGLSVDATDDVTLFVTEIQEIKRQVDTWENQLETMKRGEKLLLGQRYQFPNDWLFIDIVEFEWSQSFKQILAKKVALMEDQIPVLQAKIIEEEKVCANKIKEIEDEWEQGRPRSAQFTPKDALGQLNIIGGKIIKVNEEWSRICKAQELLDMELGDPQRLDTLMEDQQMLKQVWSSVGQVWATVDRINETPFSAYMHKQVKDALDQALERFNDFPNKLRSHNVYDEYKALLMKYRKVNSLFEELKSEAMKQRHWKQLFQKLKIKVKFNDLTLNDLWMADLVKNGKAVNEILIEARGELALEDFLRTIKDVWSKYELQLIRYQNKCKLIKGWEDLMVQLEDHQNGIASTRMSAYFKVFEEEILPWDEKLQKIRLVFDLWMDVQRSYVYLEGIFFGSADIKSMLTTEFNRFRSIDNEFTSLMKKVSQKPLVLEVMSISNLEQNLQRFSDMLQKIQKALGDYLEKQRQSFARFYFVGDEDLLEIIGNSKEIKMVQRHFPKMFAGITSTFFEAEGDKIMGMISREGEQVSFTKPTVISEDPTIYVWLAKIEANMQMSLAELLLKSIVDMETLDIQEQQEDFTKWIEQYPAQIDILSMQVSWSAKVEECLKKGSQTLIHVEKRTFSVLELLADRVLTDLQKDIRQKYEQLITDLVHQRDVTRRLLSDGIASPGEFAWLYHMRFYFNQKQKNALEQLQIKVANGLFYYGFEYLGVSEKLVQTPLTDRCYLTLTQALHWRLGGSPFGPAGTGKTESVKALGSQLGRYVLVFNCDETFDAVAMGRIFVGLCQVGAWGCFDEFNRLEERMLSAVSQQILIIQAGLKARARNIDFLGREIKLNDAMGVFITMNPDYAGRSNLPDNLKQLFRQIAMVKPNKEMIARVKLYSQGFKTAEQLSGKIVSLFDLCLNQLSQQSHYDFGLRALKSVLVSAGNLKRAEKAKLENPAEEIDDAWEQNILIQSLCDTLVPKLIAQDIPLLENLLSGVFPGAAVIQNREERIRKELENLKEKHNIKLSENFVEKVLQLYSILYLHHGVMMVGPTGCGKSKAWRVLNEAMERAGEPKGEAYLIDPKAISKDELYGKLDATTAEWTDGVFTQTLRRVIDNHRGEEHKRHWIIFDGDVDPEWAENLNSVLDDNKLLTLPSGERLQIPQNVRIMFEVETLKYATLATVSRCGMVWFSDDTISLDMIYHHYLERLKQDEYDGGGIDPEEAKKQQDGGEGNQPALAVGSDPEARRTRIICVEAIKPQFDDSEQPSFMTLAIEMAQKMSHIMDFTPIRCLEAMFALIRKGISNVLEYNENHSDFPLEREQVASYMRKWVVFCTIWGVGGSMNLATRTEFSEELRGISDVDMPNVGGDESLLDYECRVDDQQWHPWQKRVPNVQIDPSKVTDASTVINTVDTTRHQEVLCSWLSEHRPFLLCGPPGSGKTMTLMATLKMLSDMEMIFINFSSGTKPDLILKTFDQYCEYKKTQKGIILRPKQVDKWLVVFCDEINLPEEDKYGTQVVIAFLRQMTEHNGFWRASDKQFVTLERIQFVGACNPPTDSGRQRLSDRFLRHAPLIFVDFPGPSSLKQIYGTFNQAMLSRRPALKQHSDSLTESMVEFYTKSQQHFTSEQQPHYIYSPRELTRWKTAIFEALNAVEEVEDLVRLYVHEGLRLFEDRLVFPEEKVWCNSTIDDVARKWFPSMDDERALRRPILFSDFTKKEYVSTSQEDLKVYIEGRLKTFYEEELNVQLVVFDTVIDHILRIDRVLKQPLGHLLLVGASGVGKTTLTRFVSWLNNLTVFQIKAGRNYSVADFDEDLRSVMRRAGCKQEKICFIFDESNVLSAAFLERMNALLAAGEVPGLFDGEDYTALINACKECAARDGNMVDTEEELYKMFVTNVSRNLHVVFTMNPANPDFSNRTASSPALFNRCVIDWFGDWSDDGLTQVSQSLTEIVDMRDESFTRNVSIDGGNQDGFDGQKVLDPKNGILADIIVQMHISVRDLNKKLQRSAKKFNYITPRDFLDFIRHFLSLKAAKQAELVEQQGHLNRGLDKLKESEDEVVELQAQLKVYQEDLNAQEIASTQKFEIVLAEQSECEKQRKASEQKAKELVVKQSQIAERRKIVDEDLGKAEPALIAAQESVSGITARDLQELQAYKQPPEKVRIALEPVVALLRNKPVALAWPDLKAEIKKRDFTQQVINFDKDQIKTATKDWIKKTYLSDEKKFDTDAIGKASHAAGPLALWVKSIITYSEIYLSIEPLRAELAQLEAEEAKLKESKAELDERVQELEVKTAELKKEYTHIIAKKERITIDMNQVKEKVDRSVQLIKNLSSERERWQETSRNFDNQMSCLVGDTLHASGVLTYIGFFDHFYRQLLAVEWSDIIEQNSLKMRGDLKFIEFLATPSARLDWVKQGLPSDDLCIENAIIMKNFNRFPLVIDPSDQAVKFIMNHYAAQKIQKTSFADEGFMKNLETAIRFGLPLLVQDVERIDPVLNSVLNKEVQKQGGRVLIRVGDKEIDYVDSFTLYMVTRDPNAAFTPDLCSRVTFVNFTVTPSSLQNQCLNIFLKEERPEIDKKRNDIIKLQGEFRVKLRLLEDKLLDELNASEGNILQNNALIKTLETLQQEAREAAQEVARADDTMREVEEVTEEYVPVAKMASKIYFSLESLNSVHFLYQYSLQQFMDVLYGVIKKSERLQQVPKSNHEARRTCLIQEFFNNTYVYASRGLRQQHQTLFALRLVQIRKQGDADFERAFAQFLRPAGLADPKLPESLLGGRLTSGQRSAIEELEKLPAFSGLVAHMQSEESRWIMVLEHPTAETVLPTPWKQQNPELSKEAHHVLSMTVIRVLRPDRLLHSAGELVRMVIDEDSVSGGQVDLGHITENEVGAKSPLLLVSAPGHDASYMVDQLAQTKGKKMASVAIGSPEAFEEAETAIKSAARTGNWVLLKNVHLAPAWLVELEKTIYKLQLHANFRLFLTMEVNPKVPSTLIRSSYVLLFEPPAGIKAAMMRSYTQAISKERSDVKPVQRAKLHFIVAWFNAVVQERLRYTPIGWSKTYEFNASDQRCLLECIDEWLDSMGANREVVDPDKIPWDALKALAAESIFGGKVDNDFDIKILQSLVDYFFRKETFDVDYPLFESLEADAASAPDDGSSSKLVIPDVKSYKDFFAWVRNLPSAESPAWAGLPLSVEKLDRMKQAEALVTNLVLVQDTGDEESAVAGDDDKAAWLVSLQRTIEGHFDILPKVLEPMKRVGSLVKNPLFRFLEREVGVISALLKTVHRDLKMVHEVCTGERKSTSQLKQLAKDLHSEQVPNHWKKYTVLPSVTASEWIRDFTKRVEQLLVLSKREDFGRSGIWLGGLVSPGAFLIATQQATAQALEQSLEELELVFEFNPSNEVIQSTLKDETGFILEKMSIESAEFCQDENRIKMSSKLSAQLPTLILRWVDKVKHAKALEQEGLSGHQVELPVYLNAARRILLCSVKVPTFGVPPHAWYQRGVGLFATGHSA